MYWRGAIRKLDVDFNLLHGIVRKMPGAHSYGIRYLSTSRGTRFARESETFKYQQSMSTHFRATDSPTPGGPLYIDHFLRVLRVLDATLTISFRRSLMLAILSRIICWAFITLLMVPESRTQHASPHKVGDPESCWILTCSIPQRT